MKKTTIFWILLILGLFFVLDRYYVSQKTENFNANLIAVDKDKVDEIKIKHPLSESAMTFIKEGDLWTLSEEHNNVRALPEMMDHLFAQLSHINVKRIASNRKSKWETLGMSEELTTHIKFYTEGKVIEDFLFAKVETDSTSQTLIRLNGSNEIYEVEKGDVLAIDFSFNAYRNKNLTDFPTDDLLKIVLSSPDTTLQLSKEKGQWKRPDGTVLDSMKMIRYLKNIHQLSGNTFIDNFDETTADKVKSIQFSTRKDSISQVKGTGGYPLIIHCFQDTLREKQFILHSNDNSDGWFESDSTGLYQKVFHNLEMIIEIK